MCGRVVWVWDTKTGRLVQKIDDRAIETPEISHVLRKKRYNVPPASHLPVIDGRQSEQHPEPSITIARWGFPIPQRPNGVFNTRIESAAESPMWRGLLGKSHCVFPVQGFYEWRRDGKRKTPFFVHRADGDLMLLAGLIQHRKVGDGHEECASILTCEPNEVMANVHDRMPVILEAKDLDPWLGADAAAAIDLSVPAGDVLAMHQVTDAVGDTKNDNAQLMEPIKQTGLGAFS